MISQINRPSLFALMVLIVYSANSSADISAWRGIRPRYPEIDIEAKGIKILSLTRRRGAVR